MLDEHFVGPTLAAPAKELTPEEQPTPFQRLGRAKNRLNNATHALSKGSARIGSVDEEITMVRDKLAQLKVDREAAVTNRQDKQKQVDEIAAEFQLANEAVKHANESPPHAPKDDARGSANKRGFEETSEEETALVDNIKQALESALSERVPAASPDEMDSDDPPEKLLEAMRQLWAQSVAQRAAAKASDKDGKEDAPLQKQARSG